MEQALFLQKLNYMHNNPIEPPWKLCNYSKEYKYSSAAFMRMAMLTLIFYLTTSTQNPSYVLAEVFIIAPLVAVLLSYYRCQKES